MRKRGGGRELLEKQPSCQEVTLEALVHTCGGLAIGWENTRVRDVVAPLVAARVAALHSGLLSHRIVHEGVWHPLSRLGESVVLLREVLRSSRCLVHKKPPHRVHLLSTENPSSRNVTKGVRVR